MKGNCSHRAVPTTCEHPGRVSRSWYPPLETGRAILPIVILAHGRPDSLRACLKSLQDQPGVNFVQLVVSLDEPTKFEAMEAVVESLGWRGAIIWEHADLVDKDTPDHIRYNKQFTSPTGFIARHYWVAFERAFAEWDAAVFLEEDLVVAPDFIAMFRSTLPLVRADPSIRCVSGWNDFGFRGIAGDECRLLRTSFFPGLGFLLGRATWMTVRDRWPMPHGSAAMGWDYWMRVHFREAGWECIIPEVPRVGHKGAQGSSVTKGMQDKLFDRLGLSSGDVLLNAVCPTDGPLEFCWAFGDIAYLLQEQYEANLASIVQRATQVDVLKKLNPLGLYVHVYQQEAWITGELAKTMYPQLQLNADLVISDIRTDHFGLLIGTLQETWSTVVLVDRRHPYGERFAGSLRPGSIAKAHEKVRILAAEKNGLDCRAVCHSAGSRCDAQQLVFFARDCAVLAGHFACERGCHYAVGQELPVYVDAPGREPTDQQCLISAFGKLPDCNASHRSTRRLCACVPHHF